MNPSGDLQLAMRISADVKQALAALTQVQQEIKGLEQQTTKATATSRASAAAATEEAAAIKGVAAAQAARGETEAEAAARIKAMVQASVAAADANKSLDLSERALAERAGQRVEMTGQQAAAYRALILSADAQRAANIGQMADIGAINALLSGKVKTTEQVAQAETALASAQARSAFSSEELDVATEALNKAKKAAIATTEADTAANVENAASHTLVTGAVAREVGIMTGELARGNYTRLEGSLITLSNRAGLLPKLFSGVGTAILGTAAAIATLIAADISGERETEKFNAALISTGHYAGATAYDLHAMAASLTGGSIGEAKDAILQLAASGKFMGDELTQAAQAAVDMSRVTGQSLEASVKAITALRDDPVRAIQTLNEQFHFLDAATFAEIQRLQDLGQTQDAANLAEQTYATALRTRASQMEENLGTLARTWDHLKQSASFAWDAMQGIGRPTTANSQLNDEYDRLLKIRQALSDFAATGKRGLNLGVFEGAYLPQVKDKQDALNQIKALDAELATMRGTIVHTNELANDHSLSEQYKQNAVAAEAWADGASKGYDKVRDHAQAVAVVTQKMLAIVQGNGQLPEGVFQLGDKFSGPGFDYLVKKQEGAAARSSTGVDRAQLAADVAAVQNSLKLIGDAYSNADKVLEAQHKAGLISDHAYYDGLRADLDKYESDEVAALEREKTAATSHIKTAQDRIRADQKVAQIDQQIAQVHADAAAKREQVDAQEQAAIQKSQQEWEALKRSFETPAEVRADDALAQIAKLDDALKNVHLTAAQVQQALQQIGEHAVAGALPTYQGVDAAVGGPFGELQKNFAAEKALTTAYQAELLALKDKFRGTDEQHQQAYLAAKAALDKDYASKSLVIEQSRQQLLLTSTSNLFGQLATLSSSHNKKIAAIGKAAAIAQTIINTYQSATEAYASLAGIPYIGPVLGAAAAAAAIAAGLANVAAIRSQPTGGYAGGGAIDGPGTKTSDSIVIRASRGEYMQQAAAVDYYGLDFMDSVNNLQYPKYATGGPIGDAPRLTAPRVSTPRLSDASVSRGAPQPLSIKSVLVLDKDLIPNAMSGADGSRVTMAHIKANIPTIRAWVNGKKS